VSAGHPGNGTRATRHESDTQSERQPGSTAD